MALTPEQRETRRTMIGSSDAAAILGLDPYRSAADVWLEKTGQVDGFEGNAATEAGVLLEPAVLSWAEMQLGKLERDVMIIHPTGLLCANLDARLVDRPAIVEGKTTGIVGPVDPDYKEPGTDEVPDRVTVQTHHQFILAGPGVRVAYVPVLIGGRGFVMYEVPRNDELVEMIEARGLEFMERFVRSGRRPDDYKPSLSFLKRVRREPGKVVHVSDSLVDNLIIAKAAKKQAEEDHETAQVAILAAMDDADGAIYTRGRLTYLEQERKGYSVPDGKYRVLRLSPDKPAKQITSKRTVKTASPAPKSLARGVA